MGKRTSRPSFEDLSTYAKEISAEIRRMAHGLRKSQGTRDGMLSRSDDSQQLALLTDTLQMIAAAFQELREVIPANIFTNWGVESRLLCLGLVAQWLGSDSGDEEETPTSALHGNTGTIPMTGLIDFLGLHKKSGALLVETTDEDFRVEFESGDVVHAESSNAPKGERLGDYLVAQGAVTEKDLERALTKYKRSRLTVGQILSRENLISNDDLRASLRLQMHALIARMLSATDARFKFEESSGRGSMERVRLNVTQLLLETARVTDELTRDRLAREAKTSLDEAPSISEADDADEAVEEIDLLGQTAPLPIATSLKKPDDDDGPPILRGPSQFF